MKRKIVGVLLGLAAIAAGLYGIVLILPVVSGLLLLAAAVFIGGKSYYLLSDSANRDFYIFRLGPKESRPPVPNKPRERRI